MIEMCGVIFIPQMAGFLIFTVASVAIFSAVILSIPGDYYLTTTTTVYNIMLLIVLLGRVVLSLFGILSAPEIYTAAIGFYLIWAMIRCGTTVFSYATAGLKSFLSETLKWTVIVCISNDCGIELLKYVIVVLSFYFISFTLNVLLSPH